MTTIRLVTAATAANPTVHDIFLDDSGQMEFIGSDITATTDYARAIAQKVKTRWLFVAGEWYLDQRQGTPWKKRILKKGVTATTVKRVLTEVAITTPGVQEVKTLDVSVNAATRVATVTDFVAVTDTRTIVDIAALDGDFIIEVPHG